MKHIKQVIGALFLCILIFSGCQKEASTTPSLNNAKSATRSSPGNALVAKAKLDKMLASMPAGYKKRIEGNLRIILKQHPQYRAYIKRAMVPAACHANTRFDQWI